MKPVRSLPLLIGRKPVLEALQGGTGIEKIFLLRTATGPEINTIKQLAKEYNVPMSQVPVEKLNGMTITISQKAGVDGRLFGSVTNFDIAEALTKQGFAVEKAQVRMPTGPLKTAGEHPVAVALHTDVVVDVTIAVQGEAA